MTKFTTAAEELLAFNKANAATQMLMMDAVGVLDEENCKNAKTRKAAYASYVENKAYEVVTEEAGETVETTPSTDTENISDDAVESVSGDSKELDGDVTETNEPGVANEDSPTNGNDLDDDEVFVALNKTQKDRLAELSDEVLSSYHDSIFVPEDMPSQKDRRECKYQMGAALREARNIFPSDKQFGEWVLNEINDPLLEKGDPVINQKTLFNYRKLAEFGTYEDCETIGFTNVYKISQEGKEELLTQVKGMLTGEIENDEGETYSGKEVSLYLKDIITPPKAKTYNQEQLDAMLDGYVDEDVLEEMREDAQVDSMTKVYLEYFGIQEDEFTSETIKVQHRSAMKRFHPDNHGNAYISDFHFANSAFEFLRKRLL
ncbi:hypothetical protein VPDG_00002 [Vibrio phage henriette 12B8]|uniref:hypothetical protein n=1 Tax=Vibrio phage henriette 12B8 TaxID=573174 RepID=UPI0002C12819|nr:hypothetical protein VPDG_00002 [Vibrio phage henriette 12B8]AGG58164.1 hypothetical protein VPDG_00002 [Vibrio phage henriette 12B8]